ncbi:MAG TPA: alpha/beta hydrolase [Candidatus Alistipes excrementipullorum]|nr:alpha/beta hydrolase [Candidatus Alistipes excrementipullorum]
MKKLLTLAMALTTMTCFAQYEQDSSIKIWDNSTAPHSNELTGEEYNQKPFRLVNTTSAELFVYNADKAKATGQAVVICPGGGYGQLSMDQEGFLMAQWLAKNGIAGFVLKYRLPNGHKEVPLEDAIEALRIVRKNADKYGIDPHKVGIMGFSAGGHLAAYTSNFAEEKDKPDFSILFYPVITANNYTTHIGTFNNLLGRNRTECESDAYSMEKCVTEKTPPTILLLSDDDRTVPAAGAAMYYAALKYYGVKASMYVFPSGGHGWGNYDRFSYQKEWQNLLLRWLDEL